MSQCKKADCSYVNILIYTYINNRLKFRNKIGQNSIPIKNASFTLFQTLCEVANSKANKILTLTVAIVSSQLKQKKTIAYD